MSDSSTATTTTTGTDASTAIALRPFSDLATLDLSEQFLADYEPLNPAAQAQLYEDLQEDGIELHLGHLTRVKVPTGGITQFQITDEDNVEQAVRTLTGVVLAAVDRRSFWQRRLDEAGDDGAEKGPPDCSSRDGKFGERDGMYGVGSEAHSTGECATCPMAARGSAGTGTQASKCKAQKLLFLASTQENLPMVLTVPAGSLKSYTNFRVGGAIKRKRSGPRGTKELQVSLKKVKNPKGIEYAEMVFTATGRQFSEDEETLIREFKKRMQVMIQENQAALDAMSAASARFEGGEPTEGGAEETAVPFGQDTGDGDLVDEVDTGSRKR